MATSKIGFSGATPPSQSQESVTFDCECIGMWTSATLGYTSVALPWWLDFDNAYTLEVLCGRSDEDKQKGQQMNKGTKIRTALRVLVSVYSALCVWQVAINEIGDMLGIKWVAIICAIAIVIFGFTVDVVTHWYNNDFTPSQIEREYVELSRLFQALFVSKDGYVIDTGNYRTANRAIVRKICERAKKHPVLWKIFMVV